MPLSLSFRYTPTALSSPYPPPPAPPLLLLHPLPIPSRLVYACNARKDSKLLPRASLSLPPSSSSSPPPAAEVLAQNAIRRIAKKLRSLGYTEPDTEEPPRAGPGTAGEIFIPTPLEVPRRRVGHTLDPSWSTPYSPVPEPGSGAAIARFRELRKTVQMQSSSAPPREEIPMVAELVLPPKELRRLRGLGIRLTKRLTVGKAGITEGIVNGIHERWRKIELVKIKCEDLCRMNMKRTHEILERKTGGLVIWRSGSTIILYRGVNYKYPYFTESLLDNENKMSSWSSEGNLRCDHVEKSYKIDVESCSSFSNPVQSSLVRGVGTPQKVRFKLPGEVQIEEESDKLLDGLGPRFTDWWSDGPLPVDADMLPPNVPGYRRPFRLLPFGVNPKLTNHEMTILKRLSRSVPCHFALGRNRNHQGLAAAMIKLWEKCEIAKIAVKRGARNTNSHMMAEELKQLTGGILLSRDRYFMVFYRGKDFLPLAVSRAIEERRKNIMRTKDPEINSASHGTNQLKVEPDAGGSSFENQYEVSSPQEVYSSTGRKVKQEKSLRSLNRQLSQALEKKMNAEKLLAEIEKSVKFSERDVDKEAISEEERYMLRKVGLRMKPFLLLGRRGAFDGTVENMHLHWKYRELVKIISKNRSLEDVNETARTLEAESGGILVAVERVMKGYAIIMYRGKNYRRPTQLRPKTLLTKKEAYQQYLEGRRRDSLKLHVLRLSQEIAQINTKLTSGTNHTVSLGVEADVLDSSSMFNGKKTVMNDDEACLEENPSESEEGDGDPTAQTDIEELPIAIDHQPCSECPKDDDEASLEENSSDIEEGDDNPTEQTDIEELTIAIDHQQCSEYPKEKRASPASMRVFRTPNYEALPHVESGEHGLKHELASDVARSFKAVPLSNKERLLLRKQALKMKKKPVLAVGRNNVVSGVAKAIKLHFRKYPLAIVNIKGIAKGTSVQEVVSKLERATGSVLVSREPSKVILFRGWGEGVKPISGRKDNVANAGKPSLTNEELSSELLNAIRIESGLQTASVNEYTRTFSVFGDPIQEMTGSKQSSD